jgi:hypothetical protein
MSPRRAMLVAAVTAPLVAIGIVVVALTSLGRVPNRFSPPTVVPASGYGCPYGSEPIWSSGSEPIWNVGCAIVP